MAGFRQNAKGPGFSGNVDANQNAPSSQLEAENIQNMYNPQPTLPVVPPSGAEEVQKVIQNKMPTAEVPRLMQPGIGGVFTAPYVESYDTLAQATQNPWLSAGAYQAKIDPNTNDVIRDEAGNPIESEVPLSDYAIEQERQRSSLRDFSNMNVDEYEDSPVDLAKNLLTTAAESGNIHLTPAKIDQVTKTSATLLELGTQNMRNELFSDNEDSIRLPKVDPSTGVAYTTSLAAGTEILQTYGGFHGEALANAVKVLPTYLALSESYAISQMASESNPDFTPIDMNGEAMDDAVPSVNFVNSIVSNLGNALNNRGLFINPDAVYKLGQATAAAALQSGRVLEYRDKNDQPVYVASRESKSNSKDMKTLAAATVGGEKRHMASHVPMGEFINPGNKVTQGSIKVPNAIHATAQLAKNILSSIAEKFNLKSVQSTTHQLKDIVDNYDEDLGYSTSMFADRHKMGESAFNELKNSTKPDNDYDARDQFKIDKYKDKQEQHAREEVENKINKLKYELSLAQNDLGKLLYTSYAHATANHRFDRRNPDTDIVNSKGGIREMLNFGLNAVGKSTMLFDPKEIAELKLLAQSVFKKVGVDRQKALMALTPFQRSALGVMEMAVNNYYGYVSEDRKPTAGRPEIENINDYTPEIGNYLANLGRMYNEWLLDPTKADERIVSLLAGMPRGEASANQNLWDDMYNMQTAFKDPAKKQTAVNLTAMNFDDGNQNGIFIQSLYAGNPETALRLSQYHPKLGNMRDHTFNTMLDELDTFLVDKTNVMNGWRNFFDEVLKSNNSVISDLIKKPLMETSYSKDAGMYFENVYSFLNNPKYNAMVFKHLVQTGLYSDSKDGTGIMQASKDLNLGLEAALRKVVDSTYTKNLARYGRLFAILDTVPSHKGVTGDTIQYSTAEVGFITDESKDAIGLSDEGSTTIEPGFEETTFSTRDPNYTMNVREGRRQLTPTAKAPRQSFYSKVTNTHDSYDSPYGSRLSRQIGVLSVQSTDADLLKLMLVNVNKDRKLPLPVMTVHDALITTPDSMHIYRNAYNNIAIPQAIPEIKQFGKRIDKAYEDAKANVFNNILGGRNYIGIGTKGKYRAMGDYFNDLANKLESESYKSKFDKEFTKGKKSNGWKNYVERTTDVLEEASRLGWQRDSTNLAVNRNAFKALFTLIEKNERMSGAEDIRKDFVNNFESGVERTYKALYDNKYIKQHGIAQMTTAGASGSAVKYFKPEKKITEPKQSIPFEEDIVTPTENKNKKSFQFNLNKQDGFSEAQLYDLKHGSIEDRYQAYLDLEDKIKREGIKILNGSTKRNQLKEIYNELSKHIEYTDKSGEKWRVID